MGPIRGLTPRCLFRVVPCAEGGAGSPADKQKHATKRGDGRKGSVSRKSHGVEAAAEQNNPDGKGRHRKSFSAPATGGDGDSENNGSMNQMVERGRFPPTRATCFLKTGREPVCSESTQGHS